MCHIQQCFICRPLYSTVMEAAGIEPKTGAALALTVRGSIGLNLFVSPCKIHTCMQVCLHAVEQTCISFSLPCKLFEYRAGAFTALTNKGPLL
jgi:hypothetical protein